MLDLKLISLDEKKQYYIDDRYYQFIEINLANQKDLHVNLAILAYQGIYAFKHLILILFGNVKSVEKTVVFDELTKELLNDRDFISHSRNEQRILTNWVYPMKSLNQLINFGININVISIEKGKKKNNIFLEENQRSLWGKIIEEKSQKSSESREFKNLIYEIYAKAKRLNNIGGFVYVKDARLIAEEFYSMDKETFDGELCNFLKDNFARIEIGQGISSGLTMEDAITYKSERGDIPIYYFLLK